MTKKEAKLLNIGIYRLYWKEGGHSMAAVGRLFDGNTWFAPVNWVSSHGPGSISTDWKRVSWAKQLLLGEPTNSESDPFQAKKEHA